MLLEVSIEIIIIIILILLFFLCFFIQLFPLFKGFIIILNKCIDSLFWKSI